MPRIFSAFVCSLIQILQSFLGGKSPAQLQQIDEALFSRQAVELFNAVFERFVFGVGEMAQQTHQSTFLFFGKRLDGFDWYIECDGKSVITAAGPESALSENFLKICPRPSRPVMSIRHLTNNTATETALGVAQQGFRNRP